jgi:hypothetical protein
VVLSLLMRANFGLRRRAEIWCLTRFTRFVFQDALELRIYLHNRSLMKYAEKMEASGIDLIDLMSMKPAELVSKFGMKKTQAATFVDTTLSCGIEMPPDLELPRGPSGRRRSYTTSRTIGAVSPVSEVSAPALSKPLSVTRRPPSREPERARLIEGPFAFGNSSSRDSSSSRDQNSDSRESDASASGFEPPALLRPLDATKPNQPKGIFGASSSNKGLFGMLKSPSSGDVTKLSSIEKVSLRVLAPELKIGVDPAAEKAAKKGTKQAQTCKASSLFSEKQTLFFCIRRPGYVSHTFLVSTDTKPCKARESDAFGVFQQVRDVSCRSASTVRSEADF